MALNNTNSNRDIFTVSRLNREVRALLEDSFSAIWIQGEVSNLARPVSGHIYFSLRDKQAQVRCAMFKNRTLKGRFDLENGMEVIARANVGLYEGRGEYQLVIVSVELAGDGVLLHAFELLKTKLAKAGLFDEQNKIQLPVFPQKIGVITSSTGAAIRDISSVLSRRYPLAEIILYPVPIQGEEAAGKIAQTISLADRRNECDVIILARGGGSLEDLWAFNEEIVARAIYACNLPIVSGIGHEIDFTIADFVVDKRGATPSVAAELASPDMHQLSRAIVDFERQLRKQMQQSLVLMRHRIESLASRLRDPERQLQEMSQRVDECSLRLTHIMRLLIGRGNANLLELSGRLSNMNPALLLHQYKHKTDGYKNRFCQNMLVQLEKTRQKLNYLAWSLHAVSPLATLGRGYAIVTNLQHDAIVSRADSLNIGDQISTQVEKGEIISTVDAVKMHS